MNKHLLSTIAAAMLPLSAQGAIAQASGSYSYLGSRSRDAALSSAIHHSSQQSYNKLDDKSDTQLQVISAQHSLFLTPFSTSEKALDLTIQQHTQPDEILNADIERVNGLELVENYQVNELIIIDQAVPDKHLFYKALKPGGEIREIDSSKDGLEQLKAILANYQNLNALHIVSHADDGVVFLGSSNVNEELLREEVNTLATMNKAMKDGADVFFYGCNLAKSEKGEALLELIQVEANVDVAASNNLTGNMKQGGDWQLEIVKGDISSEQPFSDIAVRDFSHTLASEVYTSGSFCVAGCGTPSTSLTSSDGHFVFTGNADGSGEDVHAYNTFRPDDGMYFDYQASIDGDTTGSFNFASDGVTVGSFELTGLVYSTYYGTCSGGSVVGYVAGGGTVSNSLTWSGTNTSATLSNFSGVQITHFTVNGSGCSTSVYQGMGVRSFTVDNKQPPTDSDGSLTAASTVSEPVAINTTVDSVGEAVDVFDFTLSDGGSSDGLAMGVSQIVLNVSGTTTDSEREKVTWRLNGNDVSNVTGVYNAGANTITFSGLGISVANSASEIYTVNAYYNDNTGITEGKTFVLSVDGDTDLTVGSSGTQMAATSAVTNGAGGTFDVTASALVFSTQPSGSVSGSVLTTQPVIVAQDAFGNTDIDFTETVTLTEASAGSLSSSTVAASSGVATFSNLNYTATADQQSFTLTANDQDGVGSNLATVDANAITSDVVATQLAFSTQPDPLFVNSSSATSFSTVPVVNAVDSNGIVDTGYSTGISLAEVNGAGSALMSTTGDTDGSGATVTITPSSGIATFTAMQVTYTASGGSSENFNLQASSGGLTTANSSQLTGLVSDSDGSLTSASGVSEPVGINTTVDTTGEAVDIFDFTLSDGGTVDGQAMTVSQVVVNVSGTTTDVDRAKVTWRLNGNDAINVTGVYNAGSDTITFSGLSISIADGASETYTVNAYFNDNTGITEGSTFVLSVDGDTDLTLGGSGSQMGVTSAITNGAGGNFDIVATQLAFTAQPAGSVSGVVLTTQPVITAQDAFGNTDINFTETITLTEASAGILTGNTQTAVAGVATFTALNYTATADQQSFTLTANDQDIVGSDLSTVNASSVTSDVVATQLSFDTQPTPTTILNGVSTNFTTVPVVSAQDSNGLVDTGYSTAITLAEINGAGSATLNGTGDTDGSGATVTITPSSGIANFTGMAINYSVSGSIDETFNIQATSGSLTTANSSQLTVTVNTAPILTNLTTSYVIIEDVASAINLSAATFADTEGDNLTVTLAVNSGTIASTDGSVSIGGVTIANSGTSSMTIAGSIADIHTYLDTVSKIVVTTATNSLTDIILTVTPNDGVVSGASATSTLSVTSVNDEPTLTATASNPIYTENAPAASLFTNAAVSTVESGQFITALTVTITNVDDTSDEILNLDGSAISLVVGSGTTATNSFGYSVAVVGTTATVTLSGRSVADASMQTLVNAITYQNNSEKPTTTDTRIVTLASISDDGGTDDGGDFVAAISVSSTVTVVAVNDIPVIANLDGDSFNYNEDSGALIIDQASALTLTDVDSADFDGGNITVTITSGEDAAEDLLSLSVAGTVSLVTNTAGADVSVDNVVIGTLANNITEGNDLVVNLNTNATPVNIQTLLRAVTYSNTDSGAPTTGARNVRVTVTDDDGGVSANNDVTITVAGVNDDADIGGDLTGGTIEDNGTGATGSLTVTDVDTNESTFTAQTAITTTYGTFSVDTSGNWTYDLNSSKAAVQALANGATMTDIITIASVDGTQKQITITITGVNGVATITGISAGAATEDDATQISGSLAITDEDTGEAVFVAQTNAAGSYGAFNLATSGNWTYDLDSTKAAVQALPDGSTLTDSFTATSADGTDSQLVTITITGVNGVATITGTSTGAATEDDATQISGSLAITDEDTGEAVFVAQTNSEGSYGFFSLSLTGTWDYQLDNSNLDVQILPEGETLTDSFTVNSFDGTDSQVVTITITGINDVATITGTSIADTNEDNTAQVTGSLAITDKDTGEAIFMMQSGVAGAYGIFNIDNQGNWTFTLDNDNTEVQQMSSGEQLTDSFTAMSIDGTDSQVITVNVFGVNDAPNAEHDELTIDINVDNVYVLDVLANDSDVDGDTLSIVGTNTSLGTVSTNGESLTLTTQAGFVGQVALTYTITDGNNAFSEATVDVNITGALSETAPVITVPDTVEVNAVGLFTKVDLGVATALNSKGQPVPISLVDGAPLFRSGNSIAYWQAIDPKTELTTVASQKVIVHPIISLGKDQVVVEGKKVSVDIILNGEAPAYPVVIALSISGSVDENDYAIETQEVTIESGTQTSVLIDIIQDNVIEGNETLILSLGEGNISDRATQVITIIESNIAPKVTLSSSQNAEERQLVTPSDGLVTIDAIVVDANDDNVSTHWLYDPALDIDEVDEFTLTLDPSELDSGIYSIGMKVIDDGEGDLSTTQTLYLEVLASLAVLTDVDSDGDLIPDNEEGYGDSDQDGIPDFLDAIDECNVMPEQAAVQDGFLVEGEPGVCLRKGNTLAAGETGGLQLTDNDVDNSIGTDERTVIVGGIFDYIATGLPQAGQNYQIVLPQRQPIPAEAIYRKYSDSTGWSTFIPDVNNQLHSAAGELGYCPPPGSTQWSTGLTEGHWCVQLTIEDGGLNDNDGLANGTIVDPGGVAVLLTGNTMPVAQVDVVTLKWNDSILIDALANDFDADGDALSIGVATATFGSVTITADNQLDYQSNTDFIGQDTIVYSLSDGNGGTDSGTVSLTVYAFENVTVNNKSKGGSMGLIIISLIGVTLYRIRRKKNIGKNQLVQGAAALAIATSMNLAAAEPQWFMTGSVGKSHANSHVNIPNGIGITDSDLDRSGTSYTLGGGINYGLYSFIVSYEQLGDSSARYDGEVIDTALFHQTLVNSAPKLVDGISLQGQYTLWQGDALSASIGVGLFAWELDYTSKLNDSVIKVSDDDVDFIYNLQVAYAITEQVQLSLKASRYSLSVNDINNVALGLTYHF